jgi:hypothetical protein
MHPCSESRWTCTSRLPSDRAASYAAQRPCSLNDCHAILVPHTALVAHLVRLVLASFLFTFIAARILTFLIMSRRIPDLYLHLGGTQVHHLNYGIFLLCAVGAYLLFTPVPRRTLPAAASAYEIGLALTFDEFGMWLHLGGGYWQRASWDAMIVLTAILALGAFSPPLRSWKLRDATYGALVLVSAAVFYLMLVESFDFVARAEPRLEHLEQGAPN